MARLTTVPMLSLTLTLVASPCRADPFCDGLVNLAEAAQTNFAAVATKGQSTRPLLGKASYELPGAVEQRYADGKTGPACEIMSSTVMGRPGEPDREGYVYRCLFPAEGEPQTAIDALTGRVAHCLGVPMPDAPPGTGSGATHGYSFVAKDKIFTTWYVPPGKVNSTTVPYLWLTIAAG